MKEIKIYLENIQTKIEHLTTENKTGKSLNSVRITRERERERERDLPSCWCHCVYLLQDVIHKQVAFPFILVVIVSIP